MTILSDEDVLKACKQLSLLVVEDNQTMMLQYQLILEPMFAQLYMASDGEAGLTVMQEHAVDVILTDHFMPKMTGLDMLQRAPKACKDIPSILATGAEESEILITAINLNISHFLVKPWNKESLLNALAKALRPMLVQRMLEAERQEHVAQLEQHKAYVDDQQHHGFQKEFQAIRNDHYYHYVEHSEDPNTVWFLDAFYKAHDILSGDSYSLRKLNDHQSFLFMVDAMGKGISASITSIISSSFLNLSIDKAIQYDDFNLQRIISDYIEFIKYNLLDDEMVSLLFALFDMHNGSINYVSFGMPPILLHQHDDCIEKLRANNPPMTAYTTDFIVSNSSFAKVKKLLVCSDGLTESRTCNGSLYMQHLADDFKNTANQKCLMEQFHAVCPTIDDDITLLYFYVRQFEEGVLAKQTYHSTQKELESAQDSFRLFLEQAGVEMSLATKLQLVFSELLTNAYEHGNLGIDGDEKRQLVESGMLHQEQLRREALYKHKRITVRYGIIQESLVIQICDEGAGFDTAVFKKLLFEKQKVHGRGFQISSKIVDTINYSPKGNCVMIHKELKG